MRKGETDQIRETFDYMESPADRRRERPLPRGARGTTDPERKARNHRRAVHPRIRARGQRRRRRLSRPGNDLPRSYRERGRDQVPSQRRWAPLRSSTSRASSEPVRDLYKDEVREGRPPPRPRRDRRRADAVPRSRTRRARHRRSHRGETEVARHSCHVVEEELEEYEPWQALAAVIGKATGVKGDNRVHGWVVSVRSVDSRDGMTARAQEIDWETLQRIQSRITGQNDNVARVVYDVTHKPPATIEYE